MTTRSRTVLAVLAACIMLSVAGIAAAQYSVVAVMPDGTLVLKGPTGTKSYSVPAGTTFNANGQANVGVADLKPGMTITGQESGLASWKSTDVMVHQDKRIEYGLGAKCRRSSPANIKWDERILAFARFGDNLVPIFHALFDNAEKPFLRTARYRLAELFAQNRSGQGARHARMTGEAGSPLSPC